MEATLETQIRELAKYIKGKISIFEIKNIIFLYSLINRMISSEKFG